ncbi:MAG: type II CRISPR RNA-guided endonuclease Cas9 [Lachnospiraceae bacterium]|nr:type II CRISPR RNA-guided endonuclease Cas9 [Lachnospiraceae bacterium]
MNKGQQKPYTIGLDIGTNSVGWAVMYDDYKLASRKMKVDGLEKRVHKNFWGVRLFDEGEVAADRRSKRTTRRRIARRCNRIKYLQEIFAEDMLQVDDSFFHRLENSFLSYKHGDKDFKYPLFPTESEEKAYHESYPTIYHLRKALVCGEREFVDNKGNAKPLFGMDEVGRADLRLVYLALHHIVKYRGHFLIEGKLDSENSSVEEALQRFIEEYNRILSLQAEDSVDSKRIELESIENLNKLTNILKEKVSRSSKVDAIFSELGIAKNKNDLLHNFLKLIVGNQGNFKKYVSSREDAKIQMSKDTYEDDLEHVLSQMGDGYEDIFVAAKGTYNAVELEGILQGKYFISEAMIERYRNHEKDLAELKSFVYKNMPSKYNEVFRDRTKNGYAGYIDGSTTQEDFYKYIKNITKDIAEEFDDRIDKEIFMRKQRTFDNGVIPHQCHWQEAAEILHNQSKYYSFLQENLAKIEKIFTVRIPYYVGPLATKADPLKFAWLTRQSEEKIRPWNIEDVVDYEKSAVDFIERMTNFCTYLRDEKVLPRHSMLYEKYMVFNELTKVKYMAGGSNNQDFFSTKTKQLIFEGLFKAKRKVTEKDLRQFLENEMCFSGVQISGIEKSFNASFATYHDFLNMGIEKAFLDDEKNEAHLEEIVKILTVFEDRKMLKSQLKKYDELFSREILKKLSKKHYTGWGRLSKKLLIGLRDDKSQKSIMDYLIDDGNNRNLMQLINDDELSFKIKIQKANTVKNESDLHDIVKGLAGSPAIKKGILQSLKIMEELVNIMGYKPDSIVVEMARENQTTQQGRRNSQPREKSLKKALEAFGVNAITCDVNNQALQNDRLYLYYLQNGKDMYTGEPIDINNLSRYDIDHIIPQSFIMDNSIDNRVLVSSKANRGKLDDVPSRDVVTKMYGFWERLNKSGLISERKFNNLTKAARDGLTENDKAGFIKRQLVETRQITKHVAQILHEQYNVEDGKVKIITLKSSLTSQFRKMFEIYKVREINDYHHAHDAYLNAVVASTLLKVYPKLRPQFVYGEYANYNSWDENKATAKKKLYSNIMRFFASEEKSFDKDTGVILWDKQADLSIIKKVLGYRQMNIVKKVEVQKGQFSKESVLSKGDSDKLIPRKTRKIIWETSKYGGFDSPTVAYAVAISYEKGKAKKRTNTIVGITIMEQVAYEKDREAYLVSKGFTNSIIIAKLPKYTLYEFDDGRRRMIASAKEAQKANQMVLDGRFVELLYHAERYNSELQSDSRRYVNEHKSDFTEILQEIAGFVEKYNLAPKKEVIDTLREFDINQFSKTEDLIKLVQACLILTRAGTTNVTGKIDNREICKIIRMTKSQYQFTKKEDMDILSAVLISQSITGLYETRKRLS